MTNPSPDLPFDLDDVKGSPEPSSDAPFLVKPRGSGPFREKYRPLTLGEVIPTCPKDLLESQIYDDDASKIYLFEGTTGTGKTTCARILAKAMNCTGLEGNKPCLSCKNCLSYNTSLDIVEINSANNNKIEDIRNLVVDMRYSPVAYKNKVYILDEVQRITPEAQQVLLTELEDPKPYLRVFLCTTNITDINPALVDRACRISFSAASPSHAAEAIRQVAIYEGADIPKDIRKKIYMESHGSVRALLNNTQAYIQNGFKEGLCEETEASVRRLYDAILSADWVSLSSQLKSPEVKRNSEKLRLGLTNYIRAVLLNQKEQPESMRTLYKLLETVNRPLVGISLTGKYNSFVVTAVKMWSITKYS